MRSPVSKGVLAELIVDNFGVPAGLVDPNLKKQIQDFPKFLTSAGRTAYLFNNII